MSHGHGHGAGHDDHGSNKKIGLLIAMKGLSGLRDFTRLGGAGAAYAFASGIGVLSFVGALKSTTIAHVAIIYATVPFAAAALGWIVLREAPSRAALFASGLALIGSITMVGLGGDGRALCLAAQAREPGASRAALECRHRHIPLEGQHAMLHGHDVAFPHEGLQRRAGLPVLNAQVHPRPKGGLSPQRNRAALEDDVVLIHRHELRPPLVNP